MDHVAYLDMTFNGRNVKWSVGVFVFVFDQITVQFADPGHHSRAPIFGSQMQRSLLVLILQFQVTSVSMQHLKNKRELEKKKIVFGTG